MKTEDFVVLDYVGKLKDRGEIFWHTKEDLANEKGIIHTIWSDNSYSAGFVLKVIDENLKKMKVWGVLPKDGFWQRNEELVKLIPITYFGNCDIKPGFCSHRNNGRVVSISGGRVKVNFNHPLAGKVLDNKRRS